MNRGQPQPENLRYIEVSRQIFQPPIERDDVNGMPLFLEMSDHLARAARVARAFPIDSV
jgi:hypothetical protein